MSIKFYTYWEDKPRQYEVNDHPSLVDDSFFEPLEKLVARILRGESTTLDISTANVGNYEYDDSVDDSVFDSNIDEFDDLTDIDEAKRIIRELKKSASEASPARSSVSPRAEEAPAAGSIENSSSGNKAVEEEK